MPVHNNEKTLRRCLDSIIGQTFPDFEVCLVINGCSDSSESICKEYRMRDHRFRIFYSDKGASLARNFGLSQAKGEYIAFIDADDFVYTYYLERLYTAINVGCAGLAVCSYDVFDLQLQKKDKAMTCGNCKKMRYTDQLEFMYVNDLLNPLWNKLYKREMIKKYMNPDYIIGEDLDFNLNYLSTSPKIAYVSKPCYAYISFKCEVGKNYNQNRFQTLKALHKKVEDTLLRENPMFELEQHTQLVSKMQREIAFCIKENVIEYGFKSLEFIKAILADDSTKRLFRMRTIGKKNNIVRSFILTKNAIVVYAFFSVGNMVK